MLSSSQNSDTTDKYLVKQDKRGRTPFHMAAICQRYQKAPSFMELVENASPGAIDKAVVLYDCNGATTLYMAARHRDVKALLALLAKASPEAIDKALVKQADDGWTALHMAAAQHREGFKALLAKAGSAALRKAMVSVEDFSHIVRHLSDQTLWAEDAEFLQKLLLAAEPMRRKIAEYLCEHFIEGHIDEIPEQIVSWITAETQSWQQPTAKQHAFADYLQSVSGSTTNIATKESKLELDSEQPSPLSIQTAQDEKISLGNDALPGKVWKQGLASWLDYRLLRQYGDNLTQRILDKLDDADLVLMGTGNNFESAQAALYAETKAEQAFKEGKVLVKMGDKIDGWSEEVLWVRFLDRLKDDTNLPKLADTVREEYIHLKEEIVLCRSSERQVSSIPIALENANYENTTC